MTKTLKENFKESLNAKWKIYFFLKFLLFLPFYRIYFFIKKVKWNKGWRLYGKPIIQKYKNSEIIIGNNFINKNWYSCEPLGISNKTILSTRKKSARIIIGNNVSISGTCIVAEKEIVIDDGVLIGPNVKIFDSDFHSLNPNERKEGKGKVISFPIRIGKNVFIGTGSIILKGVRIGNNSVISAGSLVSSKVPENAVIGGNPAKILYFKK
jgi:acetyltransferase-like isoleucine patch superfamily enzyme